MTVEECLPPEFQSANPTITRLTAGLSNAGVYRVEVAEQSFVLKIAPASESDADWSRTLRIHRLAADAGLAPRIVHMNERHRAILSVFVRDRSFVTFYRDPRTHAAALFRLGQTVRGIHSLPCPVDAGGREPRAFFAQIWTDALAGFATPAFVGEWVERVLTMTPPTRDRPPVVSHNDLNPSNLVYDGDSIVVVDWSAAGVMDAFYDLAVLSVFLRMNEQTSSRLLVAYDGALSGELPERFVYFRRLAAALAGLYQLHLARQLGHTGATGAETLSSTPALGDFYQALHTGAVTLGTAAGHWTFGLALLKECAAL